MAFKTFESKIDTGNPDTRIKLFSLEKYEIKPSKIVDNTSTNKKHRSNIRHAHKNLQANFSLNTNIPVSLWISRVQTKMSRKKEFKRLSKSVKPINYKVILKPNLEAFTFSGSEEIDIEVSLHIACMRVYTF